MPVYKLKNIVAATVMFFALAWLTVSLPYHIGNGVFGGLTPFIATLLTTIYTGDKLVGLYYPIIIAAVCLIIGALYVSNKIDPNIKD